MADLNCEMDKSKDTSVGGEAATGMNVGDRFSLLCHSSSPLPELNAKTTDLLLEEKDKYALKLLRWERRSPSELSLEVVSYRVGENKISAAQLVDDSHSLLLNDLQFTVVSVQDPQKPQEKPFGPIGPVRFFPWAFVFAILIMLILTLLPILGWAVRRWRWRKWVREVIDQPFQFPPHQEIHRQLRLAQRKHPFLSDPQFAAENSALQEALRELEGFLLVFITRQYFVPARHWTTRQLIRRLKDQAPELDEARLAELQMVLAELAKAKAATTALKTQDLAQLLRFIRHAADGLIISPRSVGGELRSSPQSVGGELRSSPQSTGGELRSSPRSSGGGL
ncbi:MAG: hypothetical protein C5B49_09685 [Bdellovibrio sp.]|nr:MAG: hypothetical protein C5B49_09685 [Bdellovibrio sp.]